MPMSKTRKLALYGAAALIGLLVIAALVLPRLLDAKAYKAQLESAASAALGLQVRVGGPMAFSVFPRAQLTLEDVHIANAGVEIASAKQARLGMALLPLLRLAVQVETVAVRQPRVFIERDAEGRYNFERPAATEAALPTLDWPGMTLSDGSYVYADKRFGERTEASGCQLDLNRMHLAGGKLASLLKNISLEADLRCSHFRSGDFAATDLKLHAEAKNGVFDLKPVTAHVYGAQGNGWLKADLSAAAPAYRLQFALPQFPVEEFIKTTAMQKKATGKMDLSISLAMQGKTRQQMRQSTQGSIALRGKNLTLSGTDLDGEFARFESTQNFNLVDVGAVFFAGPLGLVVTKGFNFATVLKGSEGGRSEIGMLVSDWSIEHGVAHAKDVAMATKENRVALRGDLNLADSQFVDVTVAVVDAKGCARVKQKLHGSFQSPVMEKPNALKALAGPAIRLLEQGGELLSGTPCEVFYAGSVAAPA